MSDTCSSGVHRGGARAGAAVMRMAASAVSDPGGRLAACRSLDGPRNIGMILPGKGGESYSRSRFHKEQQELRHL